MANFPKDAQPAFQRWELKSFGDLRPSTLAAREKEEAEARERAAAEQAAQAAAAAARQAEYERELNVPPPPLYPTEEELEAIRTEARQQGYQEGYEQGHRAGEDEAFREAQEATAAALAPLAALTEGFSEALRGADNLIANDVLDLALHLSRNMLKQALPVIPELILPIVQDAIAYLPTIQKPAILMLNPADAVIVRDAMGEELDKSGWIVSDDHTLERGGCRIDTPSNQIDAQIQARWARLTQAVGKNLDWLDVDDGRRERQERS
ncbi:flagellar assembly protein FliH [Pseudoduganella lurida]|uniref:Flagellar assembly protein FliH n=1 Tax=Pseudoduganella lurida TaxID=1036180 RepID=A0A562R6C1_9BURK|nr:flagellar assembly protein FliH [Pseudoduganella lurida]TWI64595.1 flagellar assembly protein FliH [Pseudoduganella lurida]